MCGPGDASCTKSCRLGFNRWEAVAASVEWIMVRMDNCFCHILMLQNMSWWLLCGLSCRLWHLLRVVSVMTSTQGLQTQRCCSWSIVNRMKIAFAQWNWRLALFQLAMEKIRQPSPLNPHSGILGWCKGKRQKGIRPYESWNAIPWAP